MPSEKYFGRYGEEFAVEGLFEKWKVYSVYKPPPDEWRGTISVSKCWPSIMRPGIVWDPSIATPDHIPAWAVRTCSPSKTCHHSMKSPAICAQFHAVPSHNVGGPGLTAFTAVLSQYAATVHHCSQICIVLKSQGLYLSYFAHILNFSICSSLKTTPGGKKRLGRRKQRSTRWAGNSGSQTSRWRWKI